MSDASQEELIMAARLDHEVCTHLNKGHRWQWKRALSRADEAWREAYRSRFYGHEGDIAHANKVMEEATQALNEAYKAADKAYKVATKLGD